MKYSKGCKQTTVEFCNGGRVRKMADGGRVSKKGDEPERRHNASEERAERKPRPGMLGSGMAAGAGRTLRDRRAQQMKDLGLKDGGSVADRVKRKPPKPIQLPKPDLPRVTSPITGKRGGRRSRAK